MSQSWHQALSCELDSQSISPLPHNSSLTFLLALYQTAIQLDLVFIEKSEEGKLIKKTDNNG